jgi:long-chain acyl-CoA synthetase
MEFSAEQLPLARLQHWAATRGDALFLTQPMGQGVIRDYSFAEVLEQSRRMAEYLRQFNWPEGSRIAILSKNCAHWLMSDFAIWMAGHVSVPIYPTLTAESVHQILSHAEVKACFVGKLDDWPQMQPGVPEDVHCISYPLSPPNDFATWEEIVATTPPLARLPASRPDDLATLIYTSGTTGMPKGVMHPFRTFAIAPEVAREGFGASQDDRVLYYLPLAHVAERVFVEANALSNGFRIYFAESLESFVEDLKRARPTMFFSVPRLWTKFQQGVQAKLPQKKLDLLLKLPVVSGLVRRKILSGLGLDAVRFAGGGASPMPPSLIQWWRALGIELIEVYGMTENFGLSHGSFPGQGRVGYVGKAWPGVECKLADNGEVLVKSPTTMTGYYKEPEKTREAMTPDGFLRTGDLGAFDEDGRLRITGRAKEQFKTSKGKYVSPAPIENKLQQHEQIEACCVTGVNFPQPFALVMLPLDTLDAVKRDVNLKERLSRSLTEHLERVNAGLDPHEQLDFLAVVAEQWTVENGLVTPTLKIKRAELEKVYGRYFDGWAAKQAVVVWP